MYSHKNFILTPLVVEIEKALDACRALNYDIGCHPLKDYLLQSLFLRLTGFQEQKLKCICWEIASMNYDYRRKLLNNEDKLGEYSSLDAKSKIYANIIDLLKEIDGSSFDMSVYLDKGKIVGDAKREVINLFDKTCFAYWCEKEFNAFKNDNRLFNVKHFANDAMLDEPLVTIYKKLYKARNAFAHNVLSYQENVPPLRSLIAQDIREDNFFTWFTILNLLDKLFSELYLVHIRRTKEEYY